MCLSKYDFSCAGITESGYRKLGERKSTWKCGSCKNASATTAHNPPSSIKSTTPKSLMQVDMESIMMELKQLSCKVSAIPDIIESVKAIQLELSDLKTIKMEISDMKSSLEFVHHSVDKLNDKILEIDREVQTLYQSKEEVIILQQRVEKLEFALRENDQKQRLNNLEIKGVPMTNSENLYSILSEIGNKIDCKVTKEQINFIARIPSRSAEKSIIVSLHNRYLKDDFVAAARKCKLVTPKELGLNGDNRIFVSDHLTLDNKILLNKTKVWAKERGFSFVWVKGCKIFIRKNEGAPVRNIKTLSDLK
ncbi:uncharacterized protein ACR2FA_001422 [Aphomia sociella]